MTNTPGLLESNTFQKYAPILLSAATAIVAGFQTLTSQPVTTVSFIVFLSLLLTTATTYLLPLTQGRYAGWLKVGFEVLGVVFAVALPFFTQEGTLTRANWLLFAVALGKALLTHFGVTIRTDTDLNIAKHVAGAYDVTTLPAETDAVLADPEPEADPAPPAA